MKKRLMILFLIFALVLCVSAPCLAASNWDGSQGTNVKMQVTPNHVLAGDAVMVDITLTNNTKEAFLSPITLYDPDGNPVDDFDGTILQPGESVSWSGFWIVTEEQLKDFGIRYFAAYRYRDREGQEKDVSKMLRKNIFPETKRILKTTPVPAPTPTPRPEDRPRVIMYSVLKEKEDSETFSVCCIDAEGKCWTARNVSAEQEDDILQILLERRDMKSDSLLYTTENGKDVLEERFKDLAVMADLVENATGSPAPTGADIGEEAVYALKYDGDSRPEPVLLGVCGSAVLENTDRNAQALYQFMLLHQSFTPPCGYAEEGLTPRGFTPVSVREFFGLENVNAETAVITAAMSDCEEGFINAQLTEEDRRKVLALLERGIVIGKYDPWMVTGGTMNYFFHDENGKYIGCIETYDEDGLAVGPDGMYTLSLLPESTEGLTEAERQLLCLTINGTEYELGKNTPRDLIRNGWYCYVEFDGSYAFTDEEGLGIFYIRTRGGSVDEPIKTIHCQFAYEIPFEYCGFDGVIDPDNPEDMDTVWFQKLLADWKAEHPELYDDPDDEDDEPVEPDDEEEGDGIFWGPMELWMRTLGEADDDLDNGLGVDVTMSDGHTLWIYSAESPVSLSLGHTDYIWLGPKPEEDEW